MGLIPMAAKPEADATEAKAEVAERRVVVKRMLCKKEPRKLNAKVINDGLSKMWKSRFTGNDGVQPRPLSYPVPD